MYATAMNDLGFGVVTVAKYGDPHNLRRLGSDARKEPGVNAHTSVVVVAAFTFLSATVAPAQPNVAGRELVGVVRDSSGAAIEGATVEILGAMTRTNDRGAFRLWTADIDTLTISIRRLGFSAVSALITTRGQKWDTVVVELERLPQRLASAEVRAATNRLRLGLRDFDQRRSRGLGEFVTREDIAARNTSRPSDALRELRGVQLVKVPSGGYGVRFAAYSGKHPGCTPSLWIDGQLAAGMEVDELTANDIEAMELYENWSSTPVEFTKGSAPPCGTIVVWTRVPTRA